MKKFVLSVFALFLITFSVNVAYAATFLEIPEKTYHYQEMDSEIVRIAVGSREVATVVTVPDSPKEFMIAGQKAGVTTIFVWTADNQRHEFTVTVLDVSPDEIGLARSIEEAIGLPNVHVRKVKERILLTGTVENQYEKNYAIQVASLYVKDSTVELNSVSGIDLSLKSEGTENKTGTGTGIGTATTTATESKSKGNVIDLLQVLHPTQIRLEAQILAIRSEDAKDLGILYGNTYPSDAPGIFAFGESLSRTGESASLRHSPLNWLMNRRADINFTVNALITNNKAKILSRPSVMTLSGEQATIQIGGEIPYPVRDTDNRVTISFKNYGIILQFKPIVDSQNNIVSTVYTEVSNVSGEYVDDWPILANRSANAVVSLKSGSTMVIGGLIDSSERKVVNKIPLLGDIPIIGEFFKYSSTTKDKQELIILVTPYIIDEGTGSRAEMSDKMKEHYREGLKEKNSMSSVDVDDKQID